MSVEETIRLKFEGAEEAQRRVDALTKRFQDQRREMDAVNSAGRMDGVVKGAQEFQRLEASVKGVSRAMAEGASLTAQQTQELKELAEAGQRARREMEDLGEVDPRPQGRATAQRGIFRDGSGSLGNTAGDAGTIFSNASSLFGVDALADLGTIGDLVEGTLRAITGFKEMMATIDAQRAATAGLTSASAGATGGLTAMAAAAAPLLVTGAGVAGIFFAIKEAGETARAPLEAFVDGMPQVSKQSYDLFQIFKDGSSESIAALKADAALREELLNYQIQQTQQVVTGANSAISDMFGAEGRLALDLLGADADVAEQKLETLRGQLSEMNNEMGFLDSAFVQAQIAANDYRQALIEERDLRLEMARLAATGTLEDLERRRDDLKLEKEINTEAAGTAFADRMALLRDALKEQYGDIIDSSVDTADELVTYFRDTYKPMLEGKGYDVPDYVQNADQIIDFLDPVFLFLPEALQGLKLEYDAATEAYNTFKSAERAADAELSALGKIAPKIQAREDEAAAIAAGEQLLEGMTQAREDEAKAIEDAQKKISDARVRVAEAENKLHGARVKWEEEDARNAEKSSEIKAIQGKIDAAKEQERQQKHGDKIEQVAAQAYDKERDLQAKYFEDTAAAFKKFNDATAELNAQFATDELRATEDYNLRRLRMARDLEAGLFEAARANDVSSFITQRNRGVTQLGDAATDFGIDRRRDTEDRDARLKELATGFNEERQVRLDGLRESLESARSEWTQKIEIERAAMQQSVSLSQEFQDQMNALQEQHRQEDIQFARDTQTRQMQDQVTLAQMNLSNTAKMYQDLGKTAVEGGRATGMAFMSYMQQSAHQAGYNAAMAFAGGAAAGVNNFNVHMGGINVGPGNGVTPEQIEQRVIPIVQNALDQAAQVFRIR